MPYIHSVFDVTHLVHRGRILSHFTFAAAQPSHEVRRTSDAGDKVKAGESEREDDELELILDDAEVEFILDLSS